MPLLEFKNFVALDKKSSDIDLRKEVLTLCQNFSLSDKLGALVKFGSYTDISSTLIGTLPSGYSLKNIIEWTVSIPTKKDVYLIHAQKNGEDRILMGPNFSSSRNVSAIDGSFGSIWVDITKVETGLLTLAGSTAGSLICTGLSSSVDDYYNNWYARIEDLPSSGINVDAVVLDYIGSTKTLKFTTDAFTGITAIGSNLTVARAPFLLDGNLIGMPEIEDFIRYLKREKEVVFMTGNSKAYPGQFNGWLGYIEYKTRSFLNAIRYYDDFYIDMEQMPIPYANDSPPAGIRTALSTVLDTSGTGNLDIGGWSFKFAYQYDGFQLGPLSKGEQVVTTAGSNKAINIGVICPLLGAYDDSSTDFIRVWDTDDVPPSYMQLLSERITGIYIFAKGPSDETYKLINGGLFDVNTLPWLFKGSNSDVDDIIEDNVQYIDGWTISDSGGSFLHQSTTVMMTENPTGSTYAELAGGTNLRPNFKFATALDRHIMAASIHNVGSPKQSNDIISSNIGGGVPQPDVFIATNIHNLGYFGAQDITGIMVISDTPTTPSPKARAFVFTEDTYFILNVVQGASWSSTLDKPGVAEDMSAPDSLVFAEGNIFGVSKNGFRIYSVEGSKIIGHGLKDDFDSLTDITECKGVYYKDKSMVLFSFPTDNKYYYVDLLMEGFPMFEMSFYDSFDWMTSRRQGDIISISDNKIYQHGSGLRQGTSFISPVIKTIMVNASLFGGKPGDIINLQRGMIRYRSNTDITVKYYLDRNSTELSLPSVSFPNYNGLSNFVHGFPVGTNCKEIQIVITLTNNQANSNNFFEIEEFSIDAVISSAVRFT